MSRTAPGGRGIAICEPIERRLLLASIALSSTTQNVTLAPKITGEQDTSGNKVIMNIPGVQAFSVGAFGRVDSAYSLLGFSANDNPDSPKNASFSMSYAIWRDTNGNAQLDAGDTKLKSVGASDSAEMPAGNYLYVITPTSGFGLQFTQGNVRVSLKLTATAGAKIAVTGNGQTIGDGDATPTYLDYTDFGTVPVGVANVDRQFVVRNTGASTLTLGAVSAPAGFAVKRGLPATLAPGASASFTLTMGTVAGTKSGTVSFATNDASVGTFSFNVAGKADPKFLPAVSGLRRLRVNGTSGADTIVLTQNATRVIFTVNGNAYSVLKTKITRGISVDAMPGNDLVSVASDITLPVLMVGNIGNDTLIGGGGNDSLLGLGGDDVLRGGLGADVLDGGDGTDAVDYTDRSVGVCVDIDGAADDGAAGEKDTVLTNIENILGSGGNDTLTGSEGANVIVGGGGKDFILGLGGADLLRGGSGNDTIRPGTGKDTLTGDAGSDMADYTERSVALKLSNDDVANDGAANENDNIGIDIERVAGGSAGDQIDLFGAAAIGYGFGGNDSLYGSDGNDIIYCGPGNDFVNGYGGNDVIYGEAGQDTLEGKRGNDTIFGGDDDDTLRGDSDNDSCDGQAGNDSVEGDRGADTVRGGPGNDYIDADGDGAGVGTEGSDFLFGDDGDDELVTSSGDDGFIDFYDGGPGNDSIVETEDIDQLLNIP